MKYVSDAAQRLHQICIEAEDAGRAFYKANPEFLAAVLEAQKQYKSALEQECFIAGRNQAYWTATCGKLPLRQLDGQFDS